MKYTQNNSSLKKSLFPASFLNLCNSLGSDNHLMKLLKLVVNCCEEKECL